MIPRPVLPASLVAVLLAGCAHTPPAPAPIAGVSAAWDRDLGRTGPAPLSDWWKTFHDPVLDGLMVDAQSQNLDLRLAAERVLEAEALRRAAGANRFPEITASLSRAETTGGGAQGAAAPVIGALSMAWEPDLSGRLAAARRAAAAGVKASRADAETVRQLLLAEVATAYVEFRLQTGLANLAVQMSEAQASIQQITQARFAAGVAGALDVERGAATLFQTRSEGAVARQAAEAARFRMTYLLAASSEQLQARLRASTSLPEADPLEVLKTPAEVLASRPDLEAAAARYAEAAGARDVTAALRLPTLSLSGLAGLEGGNLGALLDGGAGFRSGIMDLALPVLDFGRRQAEVDAADSRLRQAGIVYERVARGALQEVQTAVVGYIESQARARELKRAAEAAGRAADLSRLQYREGALSQLEVLDAERTAFAAEQALAQSTADVSTRLIDLYRAMGTASGAGPSANPSLAALPASTRSP